MMLLAVVIGQFRSVAGKDRSLSILVPRGSDPFGQRRGSRSASLTKRIAASGNENGRCVPFVGYVNVVNNSFHSISF